MTDPCDILIFGTGSFAQRIACDLAATATKPTRVAIAGRNPLRLAWIGTAAALTSWHAFYETVSREAFMRLLPNHHYRPYPWLETLAHPM